jgi:hypothetical protein
MASITCTPSVAGAAPAPGVALAPRLQSTLRDHAGALARWLARRLTQPAHHRLGAFDAARSALARAALEHAPR